MNDTEKLRGRLLEFLLTEWTRKDNRQLVAVELLLAPGGGSRDEKIRSWLRVDEPDFFADLANADKLVATIVQIADGEAHKRPPGKRRFVVRTHQHLGGRANMSFSRCPTYEGPEERSRGTGDAGTAELHRMIDAMAGAIGPLMSAHTESEKAHADKIAAQIALVAKILELARPAVTALGTRPKTAVAEAERSRDRVEQLAPWRGLVLTCPARESCFSNGAPGPAQIATAQDIHYSQGSYGGAHVFLRDDGVLVQLSYEGSWNAQKGLRDEWRATEREISVEAFCREWPMAAEPKKLAAQLLWFVEKAGDRSKAVAKASDLASKYRAVVALL